MRQQKSSATRLIIWLALALFLAGLAFLIVLLSGEKTAVAPPAATVAVPSQAREVILYFASLDGQNLVAETRQVPGCEVDEECLRNTVRALIAGPRGSLAPILPARTVLRDLNVAESMVALDFSEELISAHPGGTQSELLTVYGLTDTLTVNFPHLRQVRFLVDGSPIATLRGHVDLRQPVYPDFTLVEEGLAPVGKIRSLAAENEE